MAAIISRKVRILFMCVFRKKYKNLYFLRHTFATHCLQNWVINGKDVNAKLYYLSSYMGHDDVTSTAYYVHLLSKEFLEMSRISTKWYGDIAAGIYYEN